MRQCEFAVDDHQVARIVIGEEPNEGVFFKKRVPVFAKASNRISGVARDKDDRFYRRPGLA
jgi:hypothetical protein